MMTQVTWNDPPGIPVDMVLECNTSTNNSEIESYLNSLSANFNSCPDPAIITNDYSNPGDFECGDLISISITATDDCAIDQAENINIEISIDDSSNPGFDDPAGFWDITFECDGSGNANDISNWIIEVEDGIAISDDCSDVTLLENSLSNNWNGTGFPDCEGEIEIHFTIADACGNAAEYTVTVTLEDNTPPTVTRPASDLFLQCDPANNIIAIQDWIDSNGLSLFEDNCTLDPVDFTVTDTWSGNVPGCSTGGFETVSFTIQDNCGNSIVTEADIIIEDNNAPIIDFIENNPDPIECNVEELGAGLIQDILSEVISSAVGFDVNDCTAPADLIWSFGPLPIPEQATTPDPDCSGVIAGLYEFEVIVEDECGNQSAISNVIITVEDTEPPLDPGSLPGDQNYNCTSDVPDPPDLSAPDFCEPIPAIYGEMIDDSDPCNVEIIRSWIFEDACGNVGIEHEQIISVVDAQGPEWLGNTDDYLPEDMVIVVADCNQSYSFPNGYYENPEDNQVWPIYPPMQGSEFDDNCGAVFYQIGQPPSEEFVEGTTLIQYIVEDDCGNQLIHEFEVTIICSNCEGGGVVCTESCETMPACHTCDINDLLDGFQSCTPEYLGEDPPWPETLCNGEGMPQNISWFSFVAGSPELCIEVSVIECVPGRNGPPGLQSGIYNFCEDDDGRCIGGDTSCPDIRDPITYAVSELEVGNTYYLFVDGCNGSECEYEIKIEKGEEFILDTPEEIILEESCSQVPGFPDNTFCPETVIQFNIHHAGDSPTGMGKYDLPGPYDPDIPVEFFWTFDPPIEGISEGSWSTGIFGDGYSIPPLSFSDVDQTTVFEICLTEVVAECSEVSCDDCCTEITIQPIENEIFGPYEVCIEDLLRMEGWNPEEVGDDPNNDGLEWIGPDNINLDQVEDAIQNNAGLLEFLVEDPDCGCPFMQAVQIIPIGNLEPKEVTLYMFDCQFRDQNNELDDYDWEWPEDEYDLFVNTEEELYRIFEGSDITDWEEERCDSLLIVTVDTAIVTGILTQGPCTPAGTEYCFELLLDRLDEEHPEHPTVFPEYLEMEWYDETGNLTHTGPCFTVTGNGVYTVQLEYSFTDGAFDESFMILDDCTKEFGPFDLVTGTAPPPLIRGENAFCIDDLEEKLFSVELVGEGTSYEWVLPEGADGTLLNQPVNDSILVDFTNYDFQSNNPIIVLASTPCGQAPPVEVFVEALPLPVAQFTLESPVCAGEAAEAIFIGNASEIEIFNWSTENYTSGNLSGAGPVSYSVDTPGSYTVSLIVSDYNGCESLPIIQSFEVIEPLEAPVIDCSTTAGSIIFSWQAVAGATSYEIAVLNSPVPLGPFTNSASETSIEFDNLGVNDIIEIEVFATGEDPCGNGPASRIECQALDCPAPDWVFKLWADTSFCVNAPIDPFAYDVEGSGVFSFTSTVAGAVDSDGNVDPAQLPVGLHTVTLTYTYQNGDCTRIQTRDIQVFDEPGASFTPSSTELCLEDFITIDDSGVDPVATWDYGQDATINPMGELSWTSPGVKTIQVSVISPELQGSCMSQSEIQVLVNDTLSFTDISCIATGLDFVHFDWEEADNATAYDISYSINGGAPQTSTIADSEIIIDRLNPNDVVSITVTALSPNSCADKSLTVVCRAVGCEPLLFENPVCSDAGIDYVRFEWDEVEGASGFEVLINGMPFGTQDSTYLVVDGLSPGENVFIEIIALNDQTQCPDVMQTENCTSLDCPELSISFMQGIDPCYRASTGGIQLDNPLINGAAGTGTGSWNSSFVDNNGVFTPDPDTDMIYLLEYNYVEGPCTYNAVFEVPISIIPLAEISIDEQNICISETATIESPTMPSNGEIALWDFGGGVNATGTDFGPYELSFDAPGLYIITLAVQNDGCVSAPVTASVEVDEALEAPEINCTLITSSYIQYDWNDVDNVSGYEVIIDGVSQGIQSSSEFRVNGLTEGQEVEITLNFISENTCQLESVSYTCTTNSCPGSYFILEDYIEEMCLDGSEMTQQLNIALDNPPDETGVDTWSGQGVREDGLFDPEGLAGGEIELNYSIQFSECLYDTSITITLFDAPHISTLNPVNPNCYEEEQNMGGINPEITGGTAPYLFQLDNMAPIADPFFIDVISPGNHTLLVTDANACTDKVNFDIIPAVEPLLDIEGPLTILNTETGEYTLSTTAENIGDVVWLANGEVICQGLDCDPVSIYGNDYDGMLELTVQVFFNEDCFIETSVRVDITEVFDFYIPNVITINGNAVENQRWSMFVSSKNIVVNSVKIYDRWGNLVHNKTIGETGDFNNKGKIDLDWNGRWGNASNGSANNVVAGVYVYLIELEVEGKQLIESGDITVIR